MKSSRKNSKKLTWQHPEIPAIQEEVLKTTSRQNSVFDNESSLSDLYETVPEKLDNVGLSPESSRWFGQRISRDRSYSLPNVKGRFRLSKHFRR